MDFLLKGTNNVMLPLWSLEFENINTIYFTRECLWVRDLLSIYLKFEASKLFCSVLPSFFSEKEYGRQDDDLFLRIKDNSLLSKLNY